ncbi:MacS family sensor histidine kinase [Pseudonocardia yuanmonensis]|uniref:MacS family sensor histidine kinase n=1 Tax=Pseudonocardia yuanmonensis TaxID=1095914 RepID=UPI0031ECDC47
MERPLEPLWRGVVVYRVLTLVTVIGVSAFHMTDYASPAGAGLVLAGMTAWTAVLARGYLGEAFEARRGPLALADLVVSAGIMLTTPLIVTDAQLDASAPGMGSIWTSGAVLACAVAYRIPGGVAAAAVISAALVVAKARATLTELNDIQILMLAGLTVGFASLVLRRAAERVRRAVAEEAAAAERERLARAVHDGVLQVLAHVGRRGAELGGAAAKLGALAGEQEVALRTLLTSGNAQVDAEGRRDLAATLRALASGRVSVSAPAHPVELPAATVAELDAVVRAALANVERHVGADAPAWVLVEELDDAVEISVRDDGPGIPAGRLAEAEEQGRLGVSRSMRGRVGDLGGTLDLDTGPGRGTEWTIRIPVGSGQRRESV